MLQHIRHLTEVSTALSGQVVTTPSIMFENISLKREDLQASGSFKWRGVQAQVNMSKNHPKGLVCVSTGNTGKAVALAGTMYGLKAHVFCAGLPSLDKQLYINSRGATIHSEAASFSEAAEQAAEFAKAHNMIFCSPGSSWPFVYGVATIIPEIFEHDSNIATIFAPIGGGGLVSGLGLALSVRSGNKPSLVGVQSAHSPYVHHYYHGIHDAPKIMPTVADCLSGDLEPNAIVLAVAHEVLDDVILVSEHQMITAAADLKKIGISAEPGAAAAFAAARISDKHLRHGNRICAIVSGGAK